MINRIIICAGGTGGHIYPAIAVATKILNNNPSCQILFLGAGKKIEHDIFSKKGYLHKTIISRGLKRGIGLHLFVSMVYLLIGFIQSLFTVLKFRPQVVLSFGGYVSVPVVLSASILKIPAVIHEQNVLPGLATKMSAKYAAKIAISFDETLKYIREKNRVVVTGNPIREEISRLQKDIELDNTDSYRNNILVVGGSLGAHSINKAAVEMLPLINSQKISIIHICGQKDFLWVKESVEKIKFKGKYKIYPYLDDMSQALKSSRIIVSRSGATILAEISALGIPAILVPYPYSADGHQILNADVFKKSGAAIVLNDSLLSAENLSNEIKKIFTDKNLQREMSRNCRQLYKNDADNKILELIDEAV